MPLRGVFCRDDAWVATGDLFRRDGDGDYWRMDSLADVILTADGPAYTAPIRDALGSLPAVDLAVAYGVPGRGGRPVVIAAVTLRDGHELAPRDIASAVGGLDPYGRPDVVHVVDDIPVTTWYRPLTGDLRDAGIPAPRSGRQVWAIDDARERYRAITATTYRKLAGTGTAARRAAAR